MRILAVTNMYPTPSRPASGVFVEQQIKGLREIGLDVEVFTVARVERGPAAYYRMLGGLRESVRRFAPEVLHVMYGGVMADQVVRNLRRTPTVITFHGSDLLGENLSGLARKWISRYGVYCSHRAARRADGVVVVAPALKEALPRDLSPGRVHVIPCGIDLERFKPMDRAACRQQLGWSQSGFHVLFPANNGDPVKRPGLARAAVQALRAAGVPAELHYLSGVQNADVPGWINGSDVLLLTSLHEGSPTVVKEALACDVPVVSVRVGDVAERIDGIAGCHLAQADPEDLAAKLGQVAGGRRRVMGRGRVQDLSLQRIARRLEDFYRETLERCCRAGTPEAAGRSATAD